MKLIITATCESLPALYNGASILQKSSSFKIGEHIDISCYGNLVPDGPTTSTCGDYGLFIPGSFKCKS